MHGTPYLMIKTLRITSVAAVLLAVVVLASVLGYLRPASLIHLNFGVRSDKQIEKILGGPSAVDRFKEQYGNKVPSGQDTTPPLVKQADLFAEIINPKPPDGTPAMTSIVPAPKMLPIKPIGTVSGKFELLGTCCSSNPSSSFAYIHLPDNTFQWVGVGAEIGHVKVKEIRKGSIVYSDGSRDVEMNAEATPETSSLLETGRAPKEVAGGNPQASSEPRVSGRASNSKMPTSNSAHAATSPIKGIPNPTGARPSMTPSRAAALREPLPSAQISKEEQENLSRLGSRLKDGAGADSNAAAGKLISEYRSSQTNPSQAAGVPNPLDPVDANKGAWKENMREDTRRQWQKRLTVPRSTKK